MITFTFDWWALLGFALQFLLPLAVGLVSTRVTSGAAKAVSLAALTLVTAVATSALHAHDTGALVDLGQVLLAALGGFVISVASYFGLWKPTGLADRALDVGRKAPPL